MSKKNGAFVSIVTPFYNTAAFLPACIESVLAQSYQNFEYVLVDNQSTDGSGEIAQRYAESDSRIRTIRADTFRNQIANYNYALSQISSHSHYCKIVQADDWIFPDCIAWMVEVADRHPSIGLVSAYTLLGGKSAAVVGNAGLPYTHDGFFVGREIGRKQILDRYHFFGSPTSVMFKAAVIRERVPFYSELPFEDTIVCLEILRNWDFGFVYQVASYQRRDNDSITSRIRRFDPYLLIEKVAVTVAGGPGHLTPTEYRKAVNCRMDSYYRFLATCAIVGRDSEFWHYHRNALAELDIELRRKKIGVYVIRQVFDKLLNPKRTVEKAVEWVRHRRPA